MVSENAKILQKAHKIVLKKLQQVIYLFWKQIKKLWLRKCKIIKNN